MAFPTPDSATGAHSNPPVSGRVEALETLMVNINAAPFTHPEMIRPDGFVEPGKWYAPGVPGTRRPLLSGISGGARGRGAQR